MTAFGSTPPPSFVGRIGLVALANAWRAVLWALLGAACMLALALVIPSEYTANAAFIPDAGQGNGLLSGLVGQFTGLRDDQLSPRLAGDLVRSDPLLTQALYTRYSTRTTPVGALPGRLIDFVPVSSRDSAMQLYWALKELRKNIAVDVNERTGVVAVFVSLRDPVTAAAVANGIVDLLDVFNRETRQNRARALREFLEVRSSASQRDLQLAESTLEQFYARNRQYQASPQLVFQEARLHREVDLRQQVYLSLTQQFEQARVEEVKNTPVLTRLDRAAVPVKRSFPRFSIFGIIGILLGTLAALALAGAQSYGQWYAEIDPAGHARLLGAWQSAAAPLRRLRGQSSGVRRASDK